MTSHLKNGLRPLTPFLLMLTLLLGGCAWLKTEALPVLKAIGKGIIDCTEAGVAAVAPVAMEQGIAHLATGDESSIIAMEANFGAAAVACAMKELHHGLTKASQVADPGTQEAKHLALGAARAKTYLARRGHVFGFKMPTHPPGADGGVK